MSKKIDLAGRRFGRLVVLEPTKETRYSMKSRVWKCICDCGNETLVAEVNFMYRSSNTKSCGCLHRERTRDMAKNREKSELVILGERLAEHKKENDLKEGTSISRITSNLPKNNKSGTKGVSWDKQSEKWEATLFLKKKRVFRRRFDNIQDAINARKEAEEKYFKPILEKYGKEG